MNAPRPSKFVRMPSDAGHDRALRTRIRAEYVEMPGMRLTLPQAARLFDIEPAECARVLDALVQEGTLWTDGCEFFRSDLGRRSA